ncbi:hypothetical protein OG713_46030 (plasmid) [Streptomyces sp. NBC_00723]|uniref:hypothetical protein n=1 Tax=Streptomyces sp. NBC_00723 TaxID=2903673 RepID=UPI002F915AD9
MFLVVPDPVHGLVAAPESARDLTPGTEEALTAQGFTWNSEIQAYTSQRDNSPAALKQVVCALNDLGHEVLASTTPRTVG